MSQGMFTTTLSKCSSARSSRGAWFTKLHPNPIKSYSSSPPRATERVRSLQERTMNAVTEQMPEPLVFTDSAANKVRQLIEEEGNADLKLRVFVTGGGCSGFQ